jgi:hypothetical protein
MTMEQETMTRDLRADSRVRRIRAALLLCGVSLLLLVIVAAAFAIRDGRTPGPAQVQVGITGLLLVVAGILRSPSQRVAGMMARARDRSPVDLVPMTPRGRAALAAIVLLALMFRITMVATYWPRPANQIVMGMALWDAEMARNLLQGRGWVLNWEFVQRVDRALVERGAMVDPQDYLPADDSRPGALAPFREYAHTPGYPVWLAISFVLGGAQRFVYSQWMQAALDACACLLVFGIGRRLWSNSAGVIGALLYALSPAHVYLAIQTVAAATDSFWLLLVAYGTVRLWHDRQHARSPWPGAAAVTLGAFGGTVMNSSAFVLPIVGAAWAVVVGIVARPAWRVVPYLVAAQIAVMLLLTPWALRNQRVYGQFSYTRQTFWQFAWETLGGVPNRWGLAMGDNDIVYWNWVRQHCAAPCLPAQREAVTRADLLTRVIPSAAFPGHMVRLVVHQLPGLVYTSRLPADKPYVGTGLGGRAMRGGLTLLNGLALLMWPAMVMGLALATVRGAPGAGAWLGLAATLFVLTFSLAFLVEPRRTTTAYGYCLALSAVAGAALIEHRAQHH